MFIEPIQFLNFSEMCDAGIRFYEKMLNKNIAIRELAHVNTYAQSGNVNSFIREKSLPLTSRKKFFENKLLEYQKAKEQHTETIEEAQ